MTEEDSTNNYILLEEAIQNALEKKNTSIKTGASQEVLNDRNEFTLSVEQLNLLEKFRRDSKEILYFDSFFPNIQNEMKRRASLEYERPTPINIDNMRRKSFAPITQTKLEAEHKEPRRKSFTATFFSNHFLNFKKRNSSDFAETNEDENIENKLSKKSIIKSRIESRKKTNSLEFSHNELSEEISIHEYGTKVKFDEKNIELLNLELNQIQLEKK